MTASLRFWGASLLSLLVAMGPGATHAGTRSTDLEVLRADLEALKAGQAAMQRDLQEIKSLLLAKPAARPAEAQERFVAVAGAPFLGEREAALTLIEFTDFQCPYCSRHARDTVPRIDREFVKTGKLKYVVRDFPIKSLHPEAYRAHEAVHCAGDQGRYWEMRSRIFAGPKSLSTDTLAGHARELGLDVSSFQSCLDSGRHAARVERDVAEGSKAGVNGTPSFFLARTSPNEGEVRILRAIVGAQPFSAFKDAIDGLLTRPAEVK